MFLLLVVFHSEIWFFDFLELIWDFASRIGLAVQSNLDILKLIANAALITCRKLTMSLFLLDSTNYPSFQISTLTYQFPSQHLQNQGHPNFINHFYFYYLFTRNLIQIFCLFRSFDIYLFFHHILFHKIDYYHRCISNEN